jgi:hypothetical protein
MNTNSVGIRLKASNGSRGNCFSGNTFSCFASSVTAVGIDAGLLACVVVGNKVSSVTTLLTVRGSDANTIIRNNLGYATETDGTATVANGTTSIAVTHGLAATPNLQDISVTPTNDLGNASQFWISTPTSTQFTINVDADPGAGTATFVWKAWIY